MVVFDDYIKLTGNATEPDGITKDPYTRRHNQDGKSVWEIMAQFPERIQTFQEGTSGPRKQLCRSWDTTTSAS